MTISLHFVSGTLELRGLGSEQSGVLPPTCGWDGRVRCFRAPALAYAEVLRALRQAGIEYQDQARRYRRFELQVVEQWPPRPYQTEALAAWRHARGRGVVVLPTGAGKSQLALMAIAAKRRSTLVVAPTLDLVRQWYDLLARAFGLPVGVIGGGEYTVEDLTVTTYDSAFLHMEHLGARFGLIVCDECHHLPSQSYALAARFCLAPFRLGLTATPERTDGREQLLDELIGATVYRRDIVELAGEYLAPYETMRVNIALDSDEREAYDEARSIYLSFLRQHGLVLNHPRAFGEFILRSSLNDDGRRAMKAYQRQRQIAFAARGKVACVERLLARHRQDRCLVFTQDNATAYLLSRKFLIPALTHQTKVTERSEILAGLADGTLSAVVTSKVLNEGVDVPQANIAIVVSGSGSVREHVQRLGRVLRKQTDKRALLYELVSSDTSEKWTSVRRRDHTAYRS